MPDELRTRLTNALQGEDGETEHPVADRWWRDV